MSKIKPFEVDISNEMTNYCCKDEIRYNKDEIRYNKHEIDDNEKIESILNRGTPSPQRSPRIFIEPPPISPTNSEHNTTIITASESSYQSNIIENIIKREKRNSKNEEINFIDVNDDMKFDVLLETIGKIRNTPTLNLRYDRFNTHDYVYNYIMFAYNFYNPVFTMYITIIIYKQMTVTSSLFKNIVVSYAIIYPLIAMVILLNEAYYIYCKKFIYYKLMDNGVIFKWKKEYIYKSLYFWWYIISLIFICIGVSDSWNVVLMFVNQTSNLCLYIYNSINIDSTLITLNGFFEDNINMQIDNFKKIIWIDEANLKENVYSIIECRNIVKKNIHTELKKLLSSVMKSDVKDTNMLIMENFDKYNHLLNTKTIVEQHKILQMCNPELDIIGKIKAKRNANYKTGYYCEFPFYKRKWVVSLLNEIKREYNTNWNNICSNCKLLIHVNYYVCLVCESYLCENCNDVNNSKIAKMCYNSSDMDHKLVMIYTKNNEGVKKESKRDYPWYYKLYYHHTLDNRQIITILDSIYYLSILSIIMIEFYGFYIIFN